jgi:hypothetical protein
MKIKEIKDRVLTFDEQCMYELISCDKMCDVFVFECKQKFKDKGIIEINKYEGECINDIYYNKCKIEHIREVTPNEKFAHHYLQMFNAICEQLPCNTCIFYNECIRNHDLILKSRELLKDKTVIVEGAEYAY